MPVHPFDALMGRARNGLLALGIIAVVQIACTPDRSADLQASGGFFAVAVPMLLLSHAFAYLRDHYRKFPPLVTGFATFLGIVFGLGGILGSIFALDPEVGGIVGKAAILATAVFVGALGAAELVNRRRS